MSFSSSLLALPLFSSCPLVITSLTTFSSHLLSSLFSPALRRLGDMQCVTTTPISGQEGGHSSLSSPQPATALPTARVDVPGVGQGCAPSPGHRGPHPCGPACPPQPVKTNGAEPTTCGHLSRGIQTPQAQRRRALGVPGGVGAAKSWGEAESQCPAPRYSHWGPSRGVPGAQSAPWPGTFTSGLLPQGDTATLQGLGRLWVTREVQTCWW